MVVHRQPGSGGAYTALHHPMISRAQHMRRLLEHLALEPAPDFYSPNFGTKR